MFDKIFPSLNLLSVTLFNRNHATIKELPFGVYLCSIIVGTKRFTAKKIVVTP